MFKLCVLVVALIAQDCSSQDDEGPYKGKFIGKLNSYHHQVSGDVYAVDDFTLLLVDFNYDGTGDDTFFWAGDSGRPGPQGFIVPDQHGKTNILERYYNEEVRLTLPEGKRISRIKWVSVFDIGSQNTFGDVFVPDDFEPPAARALGPLAGAGAARSQPLQLLDAATLLIPEFHYDGSGEEVYFWTGVGPQPSSRGIKIPDELGYLESIRAYNGEDVRLELPGDLTVFQINWIAVYDVGTKQVLCSCVVPEAPNVPPAPRAPRPHRAALPNCAQLHRDYQVAWELFGSQITVQLAAQIDDDEYMAFGISGAEDAAQMVGADVAVASFDRALQRGVATDYNITDKAPCVWVLGARRGVCTDESLGGLDSNQVMTAARVDGITTVTYRRTLQPAEPMDRPWAAGRASLVWAVGRRDHRGLPAMHRLHPRRPLRLHLARAAHSDCSVFSGREHPAPAAWDTASLSDPALRVFSVALGPAGGRRGLAGRGRAPPAAALYVNGQLAPDLQLRRGLHYTFKVSGGNDPHSATDYHPLIITLDPHGGLERAEGSGAGGGAGATPPGAARALAGVLYTRRGRPGPAAAGALCAAERAPGADPRRDEQFASFRAFNRSLQWHCPPAPPAELHVAPNSSWPDLVYYNSFTHADMGGRIFIVDRHRRGGGASRVVGAAPRPRAAPLALLLLLSAWL